jgi:hypothetical protein
MKFASDNVSHESEIGHNIPSLAGKRVFVCHSIEWGFRGDGATADSDRQLGNRSGTVSSEYRNQTTCYQEERSVLALSFPRFDDLWGEDQPQILIACFVCLTQHLF